MHILVEHVHVLVHSVNSIHEHVYVYCVGLQVHVHVVQCVPVCIHVEKNSLLARRKHGRTLSLAEKILFAKRFSHNCVCVCSLV